MKLKNKFWFWAGVASVMLTPSLQGFAQEISNPPPAAALASSLQPEYGTGNVSINYGFKEEDGSKILVKDPDADASEKFVVKYSDTNKQSVIKNESATSGAGRDYNGSFLNLNSDKVNSQFGGAIYNSGSNVKLGTITGDFVGNYLGPSKDASDKLLYQARYNGGAIYNYRGKIAKLNGNFIGNYIINDIDATKTMNLNGGAIYNEYSGVIGSINGNFIGNTVSTLSGAAYGGAIHNTGSYSEISTITGDFIGNSAVSYATVLKTPSNNISDAPAGGAIFNDKSAILGTITGDFIGNYAKSQNFSAWGGAIYNGSSASINNIKANFIENYVQTNSLETEQEALYRRAFGGAIYNSGTIYNIEGDFTGNKAISERTSAAGGAIYAEGRIDSIKGTFTNNAVITKIEDPSIINAYTIYGNGGAIFVQVGKLLSNIEADFIGNSVYTNAGVGEGGAIFNDGYIRRLSGNFIGNHIDTGLLPRYSVHGGAISTNSGGVTNIYDSTFKDNYISTHIQPQYASVSNPGGGAIYANGITNIIADKKDVLFEGNYTLIDGVKTSNAMQVANQVNLNAGDHDIIFNDRITGNDTTNTININMTGTWDMEANKFEPPYNSNKLPSSAGTTGTIVLNEDMSGYYGKINHYGGTLKLGENSKFFGTKYYYNTDGSIRKTEAYKYNTFDGATLDMANKKVDNIENLYLNGNLNVKIDTDFAAEEGQATGDVLNVKTSTNGKVTVNDIAINNEMKEGENNFSHTFLTGATESVSTELLATLSKIYGQTYSYTVALNGGVLDFKRSDKVGGLSDVLAADGSRTFIMDNDETLYDWKDNNLQGDALVIKGQGNSVIGQDNTGINVADGQTFEVHGVGGIDENGDINKSWQGFNSNDGGAINNTNGTIIVKDSHFSANTAANNGGAIYNNGGNVNIKAENSHVIFEGNTANGASNALHSEGGNINLNADGSNNVIFNDAITSDANATLNINASTADNASSAFDNASNGTVVLNNDMSGYTGDINFYHGTIKIGEDGTFFENAKNFNVYGCALDLANRLIQHTNLGNVNIANQLDIIADADLANATMDTISANNTLSNAGAINVSKINLLSESATKQITINFADASVKDAVVYTGGDVSYSPIYKYNVAFDTASGDFTFSQTDAFNPAVMTAPVAAQVGGYLNQLATYEQAFNNVDMYMTIEPETTVLSRSAVVNGKKATIKRNVTKEYSPKGIWFKPFATVEDVDLDNGPKVDNKTYGSLFGYNSDITEYTNGFKSVLSAYAGYLGSQQTYDDNKITQNGGTIGVMGSFYKGVFYTALTLNAGASIADSETMYGKDDFTMLNAGIASKTGFNIPLGIFTLQPNVQLSYTFINAFDYTNNAGTRITSDPLNAVQVAPGLKFIANMPKGWQAYLNGSYAWNLLDETKFNADNIALPETTVDSYVSYGIGIQKTMIDRVSGFAQVMMTNGGREGIDGKIGINFAL